MGKFQDFIPVNSALPETRRIGIYNSKGNRVGFVPLGTLTPPDLGKRLYSFGILSDIHIGENTADTDFQKALTFFNKQVDFVCISGDLVHSGTDAQIASYQSIIDAYSEIPVYACSGNHDAVYVPNIETAITSYTGQPLYYSMTQDEDVFIFVGTASSVEGELFTKAELQWLYETLEANRNKRCLLFQHVRPEDGCGNALGIYKVDLWGGTEQTVFESLLRHYPNVVFFHGHSHLKLYLQKYNPAANIDRHFGCWSVHVPSLAVPRDTVSIVDPAIVNAHADAEGYVADVYENGIHLRGRDFSRNKYLPIASYWLDTPRKTVAANTFSDSTGTIQTASDTHFS